MNSKLIIFITSTEIYGYDITNLSDVSVISIDGDSRMKLDDGPVSDFIEYIKDWYSIESFSEIDIEAAVIDCNSERTVLHELLSQLKDCISVSVYPLKVAVLYALIGKNGSAADGECVDYAGYTYKISCAGGEYSVEEAEHSDSSIKLSDSDFYFVFHMKAVSGGADQAEVEELNAKCEELNVLVENIKKENTELNLKIKDITNENSNLRNELDTIKQQNLKKLAEELKMRKEQELLNKKTIIYSCIPDNMISMQNNRSEECLIYLNFSNNPDKPGDYSSVNRYREYSTCTGLQVDKGTVLACYYLVIRSNSKTNYDNIASSYRLKVISFYYGKSLGLLGTNRNFDSLPPKDVKFASDSDQCKVISPCSGKLFWLVSESDSLTTQRQPIAVIGNKDDTIADINKWLKETGHTERVV